MSDFNTAMKYVFANEGGYSNRAADKGGPTNCGVTMALWSKWCQREVTEAEMQSLNQDVVKPLYQKWFWDVLQLDAVLDQSIATAIMDISVNEGVGRATMLTQVSVGIKADGAIGTESLQAINATPRNKFFANFVAQVQERYINIVVADPRELPNLHGWLHRSQKLLTLI